jgi:signal transduction histidine kinase
MKYGGDGTRVQVDVRALPGGGVRLQVDDNGLGVPRRDRERIWRSFQRGAEAERRGTGGSGIGLTIVQQLAQEHGGRAWVEDAPGRGARFVVEFPGGA